MNDVYVLGCKVQGDLPKSASPAVLFLNLFEVRLSIVDREGSQIPSDSNIQFKQRGHFIIVTGTRSIERGLARKS